MGAELPSYVPIKRIGIVMEMADGRVMTLFSGDAPAATVTIDMNREPLWNDGPWGAPHRPDWTPWDITITIEHLRDYVTTIRDQTPADFNNPDAIQGRKEIGQ